MLACKCMRWHGSFLSYWTRPDTGPQLYLCCIFRPSGDSSRSAEASRHRLSLSSEFTPLQTGLIAWETDGDRKSNTRRIQHERWRGRLNQMLVAFAPSHASWVHSVGISYVCLKTNRPLFLLLTHVYHLLCHCVSVREAAHSAQQNQTPPDLVVPLEDQTRDATFWRSLVGKSHLMQFIVSNYPCCVLCDPSPSY